MANQTNQKMKFCRIDLHMLKKSINHNKLFDLFVIASSHTVSLESL